MKIRSKLGLTTWNIGFIDYAPDEFIRKKGLGKIQWLKHAYRDRFFADPFILSVTDGEIKVLVEELEFESNKGRITLLVIDRKNKSLLLRKPLLELSTHLSYPAIINVDNRVFVYPESSESGVLLLYEYDYTKDTLTYISTLADVGLVDATIYRANNSYYMFATKLPNTQQDVYLYKSSDFRGKYIEIACVARGKCHSRPAGNLIAIGDEIYRPAQNCVKRYGANLEILRVENIEGQYKEVHVFSLFPQTFKYNLGLHTINFNGNVGVVDGKGYLFPLLGRIYNFVRRLYYHIKARY